MPTSHFPCSFTTHDEFSEITLDIIEHEVLKLLATVQAYKASIKKRNAQKKGD